MMTRYYHKESKQTIHFIYFLFSQYYPADFIRKLEFRLMVVSVLLRIKFAPAQVSVPKIVILISKTACIKP